MRIMADAINPIKDETIKRSLAENSKSSEYQYVEVPFVPE
jgi:hypothetical protein